mgnify:CR=1 FL=1|tara:strand:- start:699 stop:1244 length:546 start_codon:yes stop_codon:yes gene_type:complete
MDFHNLQKRLFDIEPTNPAEDKAKMIAALNGGSNQPAPEIPQTVSESYNVAEGSLQMDKDYSVNDFAALAGVTTATPRVAQPVMESMPIINKDDRIAQLEERVAKLESLLSERSLTKGEEAKKEKNVKGMKKNKDDFKKRYGKDAEAVMYATATKNAKKESFIKDELYRRLAEYEFKSAKK